MYPLCYQQDNHSVFNILLMNDCLGTIFLDFRTD